MVAPDTDTIAHYSIAHTSCNTTKVADVSLQLIEEIPSGGISPRMISLNKNEDTLFVANSGGGEFALTALKRASDGDALGDLSAEPVATLEFAEYAPNGPQFIQQI